MAFPSKALLRRTAKASPAGRAVLLLSIAQLAGRRVARLERRDRARLGELLTRVVRTRHLSAAEWRELRALGAKLEPRAFAGDVAKRLSPLPVPNRIAYGRRRRR